MRSLASFENRSRNALPPMRRMPLGVSSRRPSFCSIRPAFSSVLDSSASFSSDLAASGPSSSAARSRSTSASAPGEPAWRSRFSSESRSPSSLSSAAASREAERVLAGEVVATIPARAREGLLQVGAQAVDLPLEVHVFHQRFGEALQLRPLLGRHRVEHRLHLRHLLRHLLEQLVEGLRVLREELAVLLHELFEGRVDRLARLALFEHAVERVEHVLHRLHVLGRHVAHRAHHLVELRVEQFLLQLLHQLLELLARFGRLELVVLQLAHLAGEVGRQAGRVADPSRPSTGR